ncbi:MAG: hypothetical protein ABI614_22110 [Planctomycetota bacterium]
MTEKHLLDDPTNRILTVFDKPADAEAARQEFLKEGFSAAQIRLYKGEYAGDHVDTSAKWFADTDEEIKRYQDALRAGNTVMSLPVKDSASREQIHAILTRHEARVITHFGQWVTEMMQS